MWGRAISSVATVKRWSKCRSRARPRSSTSTRRRRSSASRPRSKAPSRNEFPRRKPGGAITRPKRRRPSATGAAPQERANRHRAVALAAPQREELGVDDVVGAGISARAEPGGIANPRRGLGRGQRQQGSGNNKRSESPSHFVLLRRRRHEVTRGNARPGARGIGGSFWWVRLAKMRAPLPRGVRSAGQRVAPRRSKPFQPPSGGLRGPAFAFIFMTDQSVILERRTAMVAGPKETGKRGAAAASRGAARKDAGAVRREKRRAAILAAALEEFAARGFAATRLDDVARRARIAKGTIYLYFRDKESLFQELVRAMLGPRGGTVGAASLTELPIV